MLHFTKHQLIIMRHKYNKMNEKELYKQISLFTFEQITSLAELVSYYSNFANEQPLRVLPIYELEDFLEVNYFDESEQKEVLKESKNYNSLFGYFTFDYSNGFLFYNSLYDYIKTFINNFTDFFAALYENKNLLEVYETLETYEEENKIFNNITFGSNWKKQCNYKPFRKILKDN